MNKARLKNLRSKDGIIRENFRGSDFFFINTQFKHLMVHYY